MKKIFKFIVSVLVLSLLAQGVASADPGNAGGGGTFCSRCR